MMIIGLTGNSGSGKSYVADIFLENGAYIVDADKTAHQILEKNSITYNEILEFFGDEILDTSGNINRKVLGKIVFNDKRKLKKLNEMTHKHITDIIMHKIENAKQQSYKLIVIDAPLLIETDLHKVCDKVIVVYADENVRLERITERDGIAEIEAFNRIKNQTPFEKLKKYADIVIFNSKNDNSLKHEVEDIIKEF